MIEIPALRWGKPYESLEKQEVVHFETGEVLAKVHQANGGMLKMDKRFSQRARDVLREIPIQKLIEICAKAGDLYLNAKLPLGDGRTLADAAAADASVATAIDRTLRRARTFKVDYGTDGTVKVRVALDLRYLWQELNRR